MQETHRQNLDRKRRGLAKAQGTWDKKRYLGSTIEDCLQRKMVFVGGPRQVGKTTLCLNFLSPSSVSNPAYLNWDDLTDRSTLRF